MSWEDLPKTKEIIICIIIALLIPFAVIYALLHFVPYMIVFISTTLNWHPFEINTLSTFMIIVVIIFLANQIYRDMLNFSVKSWLRGEIVISKKDELRQLCFTLKRSNVEYFRLNAWVRNSMELVGYVFDSPENRNLKERMSCRFHSGMLKPLLILNFSLSIKHKRASVEWNPLLAEAFNSDKQLMELINKTRTRLNGLKVYFTTYQAPFADGGGYAWRIDAPISPLLTNSKEHIEHVIQVIERIAYDIKMVIPIITP